MEFRISNENITNLSARYTTTYAIKKGYFNLVRCLLRLGADPNYVCPKETYLRTSLIYVTFIKDENWAENISHNLLENGGNLKISDSRGLNPIHYCCAFGRANLLEIFLNSIDFDLSRSVDKNGNNCMHYAIRSHNINCVDLIIKKFKSSNFSRNINMKNSYGLRPLDIEDDQSEEFSLLKKSLFNGKNSLDECKQRLREYIKYVNQIKMAEIQLKIQRELIAKSIEEKLKKNKKGNKKSKKPKDFNSNIDLSKSNQNKELNIPSTTSFIFKTQLDENEFSDSQTIEPTKTTESTKKPFKLISNSNFNHFTGKIKNRSCKKNVPKIVVHPPDSIKNNTVSSFVDTNTQSTNSVINESKLFEPRSESPEFFDPLKAIDLSFRSFLLIYKDLIMNWIEYNDLFYAKEHMVQSGLKNKISRIQSAKSVDTNKHEKTQCQTWKEGLPTVFKIFENELTPSFRPSIYPPVLKKVKSNQKYYEELKTKSKQVALTRKKKSKIIIVRNSLFNRLSNGSEVMISPETLTDDSVFEEEVFILPINGRSTSSTLSNREKRKES